MSNSDNTNTCKIICWAIAGLVGLILLWKLSVTLVFILALLIGVILTILLGIVLTRLFCSVEDAYTAPTPAPEPTPTPAPEPKPVEKPAAVKSPAAPAATGEGGTRPEALKAARGGRGDDLKQIKGVGPKLEQQLNEMGFYHFDQIAAWSADEVAWVDANLKGFKGRISRDNWIEQAKTLAAGGVTEFSRRVKDGDVY